MFTVWLVLLISLIFITIIILTDAYWAFPWDHSLGKLPYTLYLTEFSQQC